MGIRKSKPKARVTFVKDMDTFYIETQTPGSEDGDVRKGYECVAKEGDSLRMTNFIHYSIIQELLDLLSRGTRYRLI